MINKKIFFILMLFILFLTITSVNAAKEITYQDIDDNSYTPSNDAYSVQHEVSSNENIINTEKDLIKDEKHKKESTTVNGIQYDNVVENQRIIGQRVTYNQKTFINNCTSKAATRIYLNYDSAINNSVIASTLDIGGYNYYVYNSTLNCEIIFDLGITKFYIDENTIIGENFSVSNTSRIITNNTQILEYIQKENEVKYITVDEIEYQLLDNKNYYNTYDVYNNTFFNNCTFNWYTMDLNVNKDTIINNSQVNFDIYNNAQLIIKNSELNGDLDNSGSLIIDENTTLGERFEYHNIGKLQTNNTEIIEYLKNKGIYLGNQIIEGQILEGTSENRGNLIIRNSTMNNYIFENKGNLTIENSTINTTIRNYGNLTINDDVIFDEKCSLSGNGSYIVRNFSKILPYIQSFYGEYNLNNMTINKNISNNGNLTFTNSTLNSTIYNSGILTLSDDTIFGENFILKGDGNVIINDTSRIFEYQEIIKRDMTFKDMNITFNKTFYANTTFINCNLSEVITNCGNMNITNCNISQFITNTNKINFINCSFSNNNMNKSSVYPSSGYLLDNKGTARLENCVIENNAFNYTFNIYDYDKINGAIVNKGTMTVINTIACNNSLGYVKYLEERYQGYAIGKGTVLSNYGNLTVDNSTFIDNYAGESGAAIFNNGDLVVNNSIFENNTVTLRGSAISTTHNRYGDDQTIKNVQINNSQFKNNNVFLSLWENAECGGAIYSNQATTNIYNCTFDANKADTNVTGIMGVGVDSAAILFEGTYYNHDVTSIIDNCTFINHESTIISNGKAAFGNGGVNGTVINSIFENNKGGIKDYSNLNITNNIFKNITNTNSIIYDYIISGQQKTISNNQFIDNNVTTDTIYNYTSGNYDQSSIIDRTIQNNTYSNTTINDTINLNIPSKIYSGEPITITGNYTINNPDNYDSDILNQNKFNIYINGVLDQTVDTLDFTVKPTAGTMIVTVQPTISQTRKTQAIRATTVTDITITPENYNEYIYEGVLIGVSKDTKIIFQGEFTDKGDIVFDTNNLIIDGTNATFTNTTFTLDNENITLQNMNINNNEIEYTITNTFDNNIIANNTITVANTQTTGAAIYNTASNTLIENNTITQTAPAYDIDFSSGRGVASTQAILLLGGDKNTVQNNNINIEASSSSAYGTLEAITNNNEATNTIITQNTINISGANFNYAIDSLNTVDNITITENIITVTGERYCDGIQAGNGAKNILVDNNNITCICINTTELTTEGAITYGVIATSMGSYESENITITNNNIDITGTANYAIELYKVSNTQIHNNNITVTGPFSMGIGYGYSPNGNATGNTITTTGDSTTPINLITEEFKPENVGIRIQNGTRNVSITDNTITTSDVGGQDTTIHSEPDNITIANNKLTSSKGFGDETIKAPTTANIENNTMENITIETTTTITLPETIITNTLIEVTATVTNDGTPINGGTITFTKGNEVIAQVEVIDGVATATVTFKEAEDATITASYTPESTGLSTSSAEATTSIQAPQTELNIEEVELTAGKTVTLTAKVTDQTGNNITGGKVTFKVNGKTLKDANGKVVYAKVVDGVTTAEYLVPTNLGGKDITITAVYSGTSKYTKANTTTTQTVEKAVPTITTSDITATAASTITLTATITDNNKQVNTGKVVFKINGKTVKDANGKVIYAKVVNGQVSVEYTLPENMKAKDYNLTATLISTEYDRLEDTKTLTVN